MDVKEESRSLLSNYEVLALLRDIKQGRGYKKPGKNQQQLSTIVYETSQYLEGLPCRLQNPDVIRAFKQAVESFKLTKAEKLQLLNMRPSSAVEIQLLIEESEERLSEAESERLLEIVTSVLPGDQDESMECSVDDSPSVMNQ